MAHTRTGDEPLARFSTPTREWFTSSFAEPTTAQQEAWRAIGTGDPTLVIAPTGSGKTLAAFLSALDLLTSTRPPADPKRRCRVLYISPLKALAIDVERNLRAPLVGIEHAAARLGEDSHPVRVSTRTSDTPATERRAFAQRPGDILITTPESLFLLLTSAAKDALAGVEVVIIDEIHAMAGTKRGAHLALSLERLDDLLDEPAQRIGLSATVRPPEVVAGFLGGSRSAQVRVVAPPSGKKWDLDVVVPVEDMADLSDQSGLDGEARRSIWPAVEDRIYQLVRDHRSTIIFANARRAAERLTTRLNERAAAEATAEVVGAGPAPAEMIAQGGTGVEVGEEHIIARAHHGSVSREQRQIVEEGLKSGTLPAVVATSSLELGIDMGAVELVVQVESPPSVSAGLQRVGRAGHQVGAISSGVFFPKHRGDLVATTVVVDQMERGELEPIKVPANPLDVLAQHVIAILSQRSSTVDELYALVRRAAPYAGLSEAVFRSVLDMLAGRYPSEQFASLRARIVWDRVTDELRGRPGGQRLAVTSGGTIPDRGLFGVYIAGDQQRGGRRVGELDEEMVYESRVGDVFLLGTSSWRIVEITHDQVLVVPAPGIPARMPFWKGEQPSRPLPLGRAIGAFLREMDSGQRQPAALERLDESARRNLSEYVAAQRAATGVVATDRRIVLERFRDELGDWRVVVHSPFGDEVNAPWSLVIGARLDAEYGADAQAMHADDGIVLRIPDTTGEPPDLSVIIVEPEDVERLVTEQITSSALFASRFRECAARALLLPRQNPSKRSPLWQQRQRSASLLKVATQYDDFPIVLETIRECLQDVYDVPGLIEVMDGVRRRTIAVSEVETPQASPFAQSLLFGYISTFIYQEDMPLAERRASALSLDLSLLRELLGQVELRELLDPDALDEVVREVGWLTEDRAITSAERLADALRILGDLSAAQIAARGGAPAWADELVSQRRALRVRIAGDDRLIAVEDAGRVRDALGSALPVGVPDAFTGPTDDPLGDLLARYARTHGPFEPGELAAHFGLGPAVVSPVLDRLVEAGRLTRGEFTPGGHAVEWCDTDVLRRIRKRSLARSRAEIEPVSARDLARFLPEWHGIGQRRLRGVDGSYAAIEQLSGAPIAASDWESMVLPSRVAEYSPAHLDELTTQGEVVWIGAGSIGGRDGMLRMVTADALEALPLPSAPDDPLEQRILDQLADGRAVFFRDLRDALERDGELIPEEELTEALWRLVWGGHVSGDTLAPLRARLAGATRRRTSRRGRLGRARVAPPSLPAVAGRWSLVRYPDPGTAERGAVLADLLLDRYGIVTRGVVQAEDVAGGFAALYPVLAAYEEAGKVRRGYFVDGLGAAQFAVTGAVDRLRRDEHSAGAVILAATDPAQPFGAALGWPVGIGPEGQPSTHRPGRKAGAAVVLRDGELVIYVERGGKTLLRFTEDADALTDAARALADAVARGVLGPMHVQRADGDNVDVHGPLGAALRDAGFRLTPRGLRLRG